MVEQMHIVYKHSKMIELINSYLNDRIVPFIILNNPNCPISDFVEKYPYYISYDPSNKAIDTMLLFENVNDDIIDFHGFGRNSNPRCKLIIEKWADVFFHVSSGSHIQKLSKSPHEWVMEFLEAHPEYICWHTLCENSSAGAIRILNKNIDSINWAPLSANPGAIDILKNYKHKINYNKLCKNPNSNAIKLIENMLIENPKRINIHTLSINHNAIHILEKHLDKVDWTNLSKNPNAMNILLQHPDKINFEALCCNPNAIEYITERLDNFEVDHVSLWTLAQYNPNGFHLIEKLLNEKQFSNDCKDRLICCMAINLAVYEYDFQEMSKQRCKIIQMELMMKALHPSRVNEWLKYHLDNGGKIENFDWI